LSEEYEGKGQTTSSDVFDTLEENIIFSWEYYSVGGGFLQWKNWIEPKTVIPPHQYSNMTELLALGEKKACL
jgi:L-serine dehydratase